jgi:hypothetical protein
MWCFQFIIKVSARSFLHPTCTCGILLHPTYGTRQLACHLCLWILLHPTCGTWWHVSPSPSDLWHPTASVSRVQVWDPIAPFSITIRPVGLDGLAIGPFSISARPVGPDGLRDLWDLTACVSRVWRVGPYDTFLHLHPSCGTWRLASHLLMSGFNRFKLKKNHETRESNPGPRIRNRPSSLLR